jgi:hypothetical protein
MKIAEQLPQGRLVAPHQIEDHLGAAARRLDRFRRRGILRRELSRMALISSIVNSRVSCTFRRAPEDTAMLEGGLADGRYSDGW